MLVARGRARRLPPAKSSPKPKPRVFPRRSTVLYYSLADKRIAILPREVNQPAKPAIYEFPRELKRLRDTLVQFLGRTSLRPNPLQPGPILRGFYFTGTRQVTVSTLGPVASEPSPAA